MMDTTIGAPTGKTAKILAAAEDLILKQGFKGVTMAAVAQRSHVGKGTPYLYWRTKEDLFFELIINNFADALTGIAASVRSAPALAHSDRLFPLIAETWMERPLVRAVQSADVDVLGALVDDPRIRDMAIDNGFTRLIRALLPIWRDTELIRTDWSLDEQAEALELVLAGYFAMRARALSSGDDAQQLDSLRRAVTAVLLADENPAVKTEVAEAVCDVLEVHVRRLRELAS